MVEISHTLIVGMTRSGKTTYTVRYLLNVGAFLPVACRFIFDSFPGIKSLSSRLRMPQQFTERQCEDALESRWVLFNPSKMFPDDYAAGFNWFCQWVFNCARRGSGLKILVADELWQWADARTIPRELRLCTQAGGEYGVQLVSATQEPHRVNSSVVGQSAELVCFRLQEPKSLDCVEELGAHRETIGNLNLGSYVCYSRLSGLIESGKVF